MNSETGHERINVRLVAVNRTVTLISNMRTNPKACFYSARSRRGYQHVRLYRHLLQLQRQFRVSNFSITNLDPNRSFIADGEAEESKRVTGDASLLA
ncbi:MAG: hypothetical protein ACLRTQ_09780 [Candidatus Borkfalkia sp.]